MRIPPFRVAFTLWVANERLISAGRAIIVGGFPGNFRNSVPWANGRRPSTGALARGLVILHEDPDILVVDKPAGLLTVGTDSDKSHTAYFVLTDYVRKGSARSRNRVSSICTGLDRETSGTSFLRQERRPAVPPAG